MKKTLLITFCSFTLLQLQAQVPVKKANDRVIAEKQNEPSIAPADIQQIISAFIDEKPGYITTSELAAYKNLSS